MLTAILSSQGRKAPPGEKLPMYCHARRKTSCAACLRFRRAMQQARAKADDVRAVLRNERVESRAVSLLRAPYQVLLKIHRAFPPTVTSSTVSSFNILQ